MIICPSKCRPLSRSSIGTNPCFSSSSPATLEFAREPNLARRCNIEKTATQRQSMDNPPVFSSSSASTADRGTGQSVNIQTRFGYRQARAESCASPSPVMLVNPALGNKSDRQLSSLMPDQMPPLRADRSKAREPLPHPLFLKNQAAFRLPAA
jgi:hypothetical protein